MWDPEEGVFGMKCQSLTRYCREEKEEGNARKEQVRIWHCWFLLWSLFKKKQKTIKRVNKKIFYLGFLFYRLKDKWNCIESRYIFFFIFPFPELIIIPRTMKKNVVMISISYSFLSFCRTFRKNHWRFDETRVNILRQTPTQISSSFIFHWIFSSS